MSSIMDGALSEPNTGALGTEALTKPPPGTLRPPACEGGGRLDAIGIGADAPVDRGGSAAIAWYVSVTTNMKQRDAYVGRCDEWKLRRRGPTPTATRKGSAGAPPARAPHAATPRIACPAKAHVSARVQAPRTQHLCRFAGPAQLIVTGDNVLQVPRTAASSQLKHTASC
jgi:hypothetical protein